MSNYREYNTVFKETQTLKDGLADMGLRVNDSDKSVRDYYDKQHSVDFSIEGPNLKAGRIGFKAQKDGTFKVVGDFHFFSGMSPERFQVEVKKVYNAKFVIAKAEELGCHLIEDTVTQGKRHIVMRRVA